MTTLISRFRLSKPLGARDRAAASATRSKARRKQSACLSLESLEGRQLLSLMNAELWPSTPEIPVFPPSDSPTVSSAPPQLATNTLALNPIGNNPAFNVVSSATTANSSLLGTAIYGTNSTPAYLSNVLLAPPVVSPFANPQLLNPQPVNWPDLTPNPANQFAADTIMIGAGLLAGALAPPLAPAIDTYAIPHANNGLEQTAAVGQVLDDVLAVAMDVPGLATLPISGPAAVLGTYVAYGNQNEAVTAQENGANWSLINAANLQSELTGAFTGSPVTLTLPINPVQPVTTANLLFPGISQTTIDTSAMDQYVAASQILNPSATANPTFVAPPVNLMPDIQTEMLPGDPSSQLPTWNPPTTSTDTTFAPAINLTPDLLTTSLASNPTDQMLGSNVVPGPTDTITTPMPDILTTPMPGDTGSPSLPSSFVTSPINNPVPMGSLPASDILTTPLQTDPSSQLPQLNFGMPSTTAVPGSSSSPISFTTDSSFDFSPTLTDPPSFDNPPIDVSSDPSFNFQPVSIDTTTFSF